MNRLLGRSPGAPAEEPPWTEDPWDEPAETLAVVVESPPRGRLPFKVLFATLGALAIVAILVAGSIAWSYVKKINPAGDPGPPVAFTIAEGETLETLSERLEREEFVVDAKVFRWYVERQGGLEITPGYYLLRPMDNMGNLMRVLNTPPEETFTKVTFPEGFTIDRIATRLVVATGRFSVDEFIDASLSGRIKSDMLPPGQTSLEGMLFPDTYQISNGDTVGQIVARMLNLTERVARQERIAEKGKALGLTPYEVMIIASMIEREAKTDRDRPLIARVILNRLFNPPGGQPFPLQIDATLLYAQDASKPISELRTIDSLYNTYLHTGLPPTPIASPGRASIRAVVNPANDPPAGGAQCAALPKEQCHYYYYVLADKEGNHAFAVTLEEHEANVRASRAAGVIP